MRDTHVAGLVRANSTDSLRSAVPRSIVRQLGLGAGPVLPRKNTPKDCGLAIKVRPVTDAEGRAATRDQPRRAAGPKEIAGALRDPRGTLPRSARRWTGLGAPPKGFSPPTGRRNWPALYSADSHHILWDAEESGSGGAPR